MEVVKRLQEDLGDLVVVHHQRLPFLGGALREAFALARGSHVILMASDLETDPKLVCRLIAEAEKNPAGIATASRWMSRAPAARSFYVCPASAAKPSIASSRHAA